jgi:hypothetical protein
LETTERAEGNVDVSAAITMRATPVAAPADGRIQPPSYAKLSAKSVSVSTLSKR